MSTQEKRHSRGSMSTRSRIIIFDQACGSGGCQSVHRAVCSNCRTARCPASDLRTAGCDTDSSRSKRGGSGLTAQTWAWYFAGFSHAGSAIRALVRNGLGVAEADFCPGIICGLRSPQSLNPCTRCGTVAPEPELSATSFIPALRLEVKIVVLCSQGRCLRS